MRARAVVLAAALVLAPFGAQCADLVVWWDKGANPEEDAAVKEIIAAFEQKSRKQVELVFYATDEHAAKVVAALKADQRPWRRAASGSARPRREQRRASASSMPPDPTLNLGSDLLVRACARRVCEASAGLWPSWQDRSRRDAAPSAAGL
jgi:hypothetical protein